MVVLHMHVWTLCCLDVTAIKPNATKCSRCKDYDHLVSWCPFPEIGSQGQKTTKSAPGTEVCQNFNKEKCRFGETCIRKHVCRVCGGLCHLPRATTQDPAIVRPKSPFNYAYFEKHLIDHPDRQICRFYSQRYKTGGGHRLWGPTEVFNSPQLAFQP